MGLNEAQEAEIVEARLTALGDGADRYDILHAIAGFSEQAVAIALRRLGGGGSPGGGALTQTAVTLDHDDILAMSNGTAFQLVAAPAAGKLILPISVVLVADTTAGAYTVNSLGGYLQVGLDDGFSAYPLTQQLSESVAGQISGLFATGSKAVALIGAAALAPPSVGAIYLIGVAAGQDPTAYDGQPLVLAYALGGGGSPLTDGNAANTLTVTTIYATIDL